MSYPKTSVKEVDVTAFSGGVRTGCKVIGGKIVPAGLTVDFAENVPEGLMWAGYSEACKKYFAVANGRLYISLNGKYFLDIVKANGEPFAIDEVHNGEHHTYVVCGTLYAAFHGNAFFTMPFNGNIYAGVLKCGRVFGADNDDKTLVRWSGPKGVDDWAEGINGAGWLRLEAKLGNVLNLVVLGDIIVAVCEYGLAKISAFGSPENFRLASVQQKTPKIFRDTAAVTGGKLYFYTEEGLYSFDGNRISEELASVAEMLENPAYAAAYGQNYCVCGYSTALKRQAILVYDSADGAAYFMDIPAQRFCVSSKMLVYTQTAAPDENAGDGFTFESGEITFGTTANKTLKIVEIYGGKADIGVSNGVVSRIVGGVSGSVRINLRGNRFKITVKGGKNPLKVKAFAEVGYGI